MNSPTVPDDVMVVARALRRRHPGDGGPGLARVPRGASHHLDTLWQQVDAAGLREAVRQVLEDNGGDQ